MNRRLLPVAVLVALAVPAATAGNAHAIAGNGKCKISKKWGILKRTAEVVVFVVERREEAQGLYACYKANGRRAQLAEASDDGLTSSASFDLVQAKGHFVAWQFTLTDDSCKAACPPGYEGTTYRLSRADLKTRRLLRWEGAHVEGSALKLSPTGNVAWIAATTTPSVFEVRVGDTDGNRVIDAGAIDTTSLGLRGTTLSWLNAGARKTATLP